MSASISEISGNAFDFVVVGGGTCGLVVAARLAEDPSVSVAVLEAGTTNYKDFLISVPGQQGRFTGNKAYDWFFQTKPQEHAGGKPRFWPRGRILGGSSTLNHFAWNEPSKQDINAWERLGNPGWNWETLAPYYRKVETINFLPNNNSERFKQLYDIDALGKDGPIQLTVPDSIMEDEGLIQDALNNAGVPNAKNPYNGDPVGTFIAPATIDPKTFTRSSAATAYYEPNKHKSNFKVLCGAVVHRLKIDPTQSSNGFKAEAVEFEYDGTVHTVNVNREVIVCAGAPKSPQILELSGIGDKSILEPLGITTHVDLPGVGSNVQEHYGTFTISELTSESTSRTLDMLNDENIAAEQRVLHSENKGIHCCGITRFAMVPFYTITPEIEEAKIIIARQRKHVEELIAKGSISEGLKAQYKIQLEMYESGKDGNCELAPMPRFVIPNMAEKGKKYFTMLGGINQPFSRGTIHITSNDPNVQPEIDPRYLEASVDLDILREHFKFIRRLQEIEPWKGLIAKEIIPGPKISTDEDVEQHIRNTLVTIFHSTGSLSMLPRELGGVVDPKLRVYSTDNVRVVDVSIIPLNIGAHIQSSAYAIGERAADIIKADWNA